jgi:hypothetical protein
VQIAIPTNFPSIFAYLPFSVLRTFFRELPSFSSGVAKIREVVVTNKKKGVKIVDYQSNISQIRVPAP